MLHKTWALVLTAIIALGACNPDNTQSGPQTATGDRQYTRIYPPHPDDTLDAHIYELNNGLRVYLTHNPEEPRFYAEIAVRAGSKHDPADATGLAHYLEHLLFKGNQQLGTLDYDAERPHLERIQALYEEHFRTEDPVRRAEIYSDINRESQLAAQYAVANEIDKVYSSMGASGLNAHTWHEETVYKVSLPSNRLEQWAELESQRFIDPVFRLFHTELEVVYEEKNRTLDNRDRLSYYALADLLYQNHPYGQQTTIGDAEHLKNPSLVYIQDYFDTWYVPNNMAIFISGDIDIQQTIQLIANKFSSWEARSLPTAQNWPEQPITDIQRTTVSYPGQEEVQIAFRTVPHRHPDKEALIVFDMILDNRTAGLINLNLNQRQRVQAAGASPEFHNDYGSQRLWGVPREGQTLEEVEQLLLEQIELVQRGEFEDWIIPAIVNDFRRMEKRSLESNTARVANMRQAFLTFTDWNYHVNEMARLERVTKQDVINVANKYFSSNNYVAVHRINGPAELPPVDKPQIDPVDIDPSRQSRFASAILSMPYDDIEPRFLEEGRDYQILEYAPNIPLYYAQNTLNDLFSFSVVFDVGTEDDDRLSLASALMEKAGTVDYPADELQKQWYRLGSNFSFATGANETVISISGMDPRFEDTLALMLELIDNPQADQTTLDDLRTTILQARRDQRESPQAIHQALFLYNRYGNDAPPLRVMPRDQLQAVELDELLALVSDLQNYQHTLMYNGSLPVDRLLAQLRRHHQPGPELRSPPAYRLLTARQIDDNEIYVIHRETAQAQVRLEFPDGTVDESLTVPASLYNAYFGTSMSSVVFQELRESRALAYSAGANYAQGNRLGAENLMLGAIGTQNDKTVEALEAFVDLIDNMPRSRERFEEAVSSQVNRYRTASLSARQIPGTVRGWQRLGLDHDPRPQRFATLMNTRLDDMVRFQQERVANRPKLISIVGDTNRLDMEALEALGQVRILTVDEVFVD